MTHLTKPNSFHTIHAPCSWVPHYTEKEPQLTTIEDALTRIQSDTYRARLERARAYVQQRGKKDERYQKIKKKLPAVIFTGIFRQRGDKHIDTVSGFMCIDIDDLPPDRLEAVRDALIEDSLTFAIWLSPSGVGFKVLVKIPYVPAYTDFPKVFLSLERYYKETHDIEIDEACKNAERLCFESYDPDLWLYEESDVFEPEAWAPGESELDLVSETFPQEEKENDPDYQELIDKINPEKVFALVNWEYRKEGKNFVGECPAHDSDSGTCLRWEIPKHYFRCFHNGCDKAGDLIHFYMLFTGMENREAAKALAEAFAPDMVPRFSDSPKRGPSKQYFVDENALLQVLSVIRVVQALEWTYQEGARNYVGPCPCSLDENNLRVHLKKKTFVCKHCGQEGNLIDFYAYISGKPRTQAIKELVSIFAPHLRPAKKQSSINTFFKLLAFLKEHHDFSYNELEAAPYVDGVLFDDDIESELHVECVANGFKGKSLITDIVITECRKNTFHPIIAYFKSLEYDGRDHIGDFTQYVSDKHDLFDTALRRWMIQAVQKVHTGAQNEVLVLVGGQGLGKSLMAEWMCPDALKDLYVECGTIDPNNKDHQIMHVTNFLGEVGELGSTTTKKEQRALRAYFTTRAFKYRPPYGKRVIRKSACMSFIGTENEDGAGFLRDTTGNRRYVPLDVLNIDWKYTTECNIDDMWAQAYAAYKAKAFVDFTAEERGLLYELISSHEQRSLEFEYIMKCFDITKQDDDWLTATQILECMRDAGYRESEAGANKIISQELRKLGVVKLHGRRGTEYHGLKTYSENEFWEKHA